MLCEMTNLPLSKMPQDSVFWSGAERCAAANTLLCFIFLTATAFYSLALPAHKRYLAVVSVFFFFHPAVGLEGSL